MDPGQYDYFIHQNLLTSYVFFKITIRFFLTFRIVPVLTVEF